MNKRLRMTGVSLALLVAACAPVADDGSDPNTTTPPTTTSTTTSSTTTTSTTTASTTTAPAVFTADLTISIGTRDRPGEFEATLGCDGASSGSGYLAGSTQAACTHLETTPAALRLLVDGPAPDRACTEIYGGGEVALITGTVGGRPADVTVDRANGCGIADWDLLQPILVEPYDLARQNASARCSGPSAPDLDRDQGELPPVVDEVRTALLEQAGVCDFEALAARATADFTNVSFGGSDDPAGLWRELEESGATPMADLITILQLAVGTFDDGQGTVFWVWPAVAALDDWNDATDAQRSELADLFGADALADWDRFGGYIGYRVGITDAGRWAFFVAGD